MSEFAAAGDDEGAARGCGDAAGWGLVLRGARLAVVAAFRPSEPFGRVISGYQPASEIAAAGGDAALAISVAMPPLQFPRCQNNRRDRPLANARHPFIAEAPATAAGVWTRVGAYRHRAGVPPRTSLVRRDAIDAEKAKPNADMIQSSAVRRVW